MVSTDLIEHAIQDLYEHDHRALEPLLSRSLPHHPTIYESAARELEKMFRTGSVRDYWALMAVLHGTLALQDRIAYADLLLETLHEIIAHDGTIPYIVARAFEDSLLPEDTWVVEPILKQIEKILSSSHSDPVAAGVASVAVRSLGLFADSRTDEPLLRLLESTSEPLAGSAALALAEQGKTSAIPILLVIFSKQPTPDIITALGKIRSREAVPYLTASLDNYQHSALKKGTGTGELIRAILLALGEIGDPQALDPIRKIMDLPSRGMGITLQAALALSRLGDDSGMPLIVKRQRTWEASQRLVELKHPEGLPAMIRNYRVDTGFPRGKREGTSRQNLLRELGRQGVLADLALLEWVQQNDFEQTASGWTLAEEARRAAVRIAARGKHSGSIQ